MKCINCNLSLPDDATECSFCGAKVTRDIIRCPKCFIKLENNEKICPKCGFNFEKEKNKAEADETPEKLSVKKIVIFAVIFLVITAIGVSAFFGWRMARFSAFKQEAEEYVAFLDENIENITILAGGYNEIYNGQWIVYAEMVSGLEKTNARAINLLVENRDRITYRASALSQKCINSEDEDLVNKVFECYDECYLYVVSKKGKYPGYIEGYEKLKAEYIKSAKKLKNRIK